MKLSSSFFLNSFCSLGRFLCVVSILGVGGFPLIYPLGAQAEDNVSEEQPQLTPEVGKVLEYAQKALEAKDGTQALQYVMQASQTPHTNAFDNYMIQRMRAAACTEKEDLGCAMSAYDSLLGNSQTQPEERKLMLAAVATLAYRSNEYQKCENTALEYLHTVGYEATVASLSVQCPYVAEHWEDTIKAGETLSAVAEKTQNKIPEAALQMVAIAYGKLDKPQEERQTYLKLAGLYPNPHYWDFLLHEFMADQKLPQRLRFSLMRLRLEAGSEMTPQEFQDMAELAVQMDVPSLALKLLQIGSDKKILGVGDSQELEKQKRFKSFVELQVYKAHRGINEAIVQARKASSAGAMLSTGYELALEGHQDAGLTLMREGMRNHPNYPDIAELEYAMAEYDSGKKDSAIEDLGKISGNGPAHGLGLLWQKQLQSQSGK
ncbi:hypothetical protein FAI40_05765 [Acetobacteraceae bacterium]|nr:hypothetical protein FAI40_05765 [Acetobacteraceae bacterium]